MTLATYNRYVDSATDASKIERWSEQHGKAVAGEPVLYWKEDLDKMGRHAAPKPRAGFFLGRFLTPRKQQNIRKLFRLFGIR